MSHRLDRRRGKGNGRLGAAVSIARFPHLSQSIPNERFVNTGLAAPGYWKVTSWNPSTGGFTWWVGQTITNTPKRRQAGSRTAHSQRTSEHEASGRSSAAAPAAAAHTSHLTTQRARSCGVRCPAGSAHRRRLREAEAVVRVVVDDAHAVDLRLHSRHSVLHELRPLPQQRAELVEERLHVLLLALGGLGALLRAAVALGELGLEHVEVAPVVRQLAAVEVDDVRADRVEEVAGVAHDQQRLGPGLRQRGAEGGSVRAQRRGQPRTAASLGSKATDSHPPHSFRAPEASPQATAPRAGRGGSSAVGEGNEAQSTPSGSAHVLSGPRRAVSRRQGPEALGKAAARLLIAPHRGTTGPAGRRAPGRARRASASRR